MSANDKEDKKNNKNKNQTQKIYILFAIKRQFGQEKHTKKTNSTAECIWMAYGSVIKAKVCEIAENYRNVVNCGVGTVVRFGTNTSEMLRLVVVP